MSRDLLVGLLIGFPAGLLAGVVVMAALIASRRRAGRVATPWSNEARQVIQGVLNQHRSEPLAVVVMAIDNACPPSLREYWPYQIWLEEREAAIARLKRRTRR